jgi:poly(3-hydroxybutyrate) depolymerase
VRKLCERKQSRWVAAGGWTALRLLAAAVLVVSGVGRTFAAPIAPGDAQQIASVDGVELPVFTYRPSGCEPRLLLLVFHGVGRDGGPYRDHARPLADRVCAIVVAPQFDRKRFPRDEYQYGGVTVLILVARKPFAIELRRRLRVLRWRDGLWI